MNTFKEIKEIGKCVSKIKALAQKIDEKYGEIAEGLEWYSAEFVSLGKKDIEYFESTNGVTDDYYVSQSVGYCEDDFYGHVYFKTDVPGQYVKVYFSC